MKILEVINKIVKEDEQLTYAQASTALSFDN